MKYFIPFVLLVALSCTTQENQPFIKKDIHAYNNLIEQLRADISKEMAFRNSYRPRELAELKALDSCFLLRMALYEIYEDNIQFKSYEPSKYQTYLAYLDEQMNKKNEADDPKISELGTLKNKLGLDTAPNAIDEAYLLNFIRYEYLVLSNYVVPILGYADNFGGITRTITMQSSYTFAEGDTLEVILVTEYLPQNVTGHQIDLQLEGIEVNGQNINLALTPRIIDKIVYLRFVPPVKGEYEVKGKLTHLINETDTLTTQFTALVMLD